MPLTTRLLTILASSLTALTAVAITPADIASRLDSLGSYSAHVTYSVLLPSAPDDIVYDIDLNCAPSQAATDSMCNYLIDWTLPTPGGESAGFTAYFDGNLYRYRDHRLQEYHYEWDSIPFQAGGGVHRMAQFVDLLPQSIASAMRLYGSQPDEYRLTCKQGVKVDGRDCTVVEGTREVNGMTATEYRYVFDSATMAPLKIELENNPGAISEQTVTATYGSPRATAPASWGRRCLSSAIPSSLSVSARQLQGRKPARHSPAVVFPPYRHRRASFLSTRRPSAFPTVIAIIDESTVNAAETVKALRRAVASLPKRVDLILAFTGNHIDDIEEVTGHAQLGETLLMSARPLARDCGATSFPTIIFTGRDGIVTHSHLGFNNSLDEIVIQSAALME